MYQRRVRRTDGSPLRRCGSRLDHERFQALPVSLRRGFFLQHPLPAVLQQRKPLGPPLGNVRPPQKHRGFLCHVQDLEQLAQKRHVRFRSGPADVPAALPFPFLPEFPRGLRGLFLRPDLCGRGDVRQGRNQPGTIRRPFILPAGCRDVPPGNRRQRDQRSGEAGFPMPGLRKRCRNRKTHRRSHGGIFRPLPPRPSAPRIRLPGKQELSAAVCGQRRDLPLYRPGGLFLLPFSHFCGRLRGGRLSRRHAGNFFAGRGTLL